MIIFEIFLQFAHEVLLGQFTKLEAIYPPADYPELYDNQKRDQWQKLFDEYRALVLPTQIAGHYWNPTNY